MKKVVTIIIIIGVIFTSGCAKPNDIQNNSNQDSHATQDDLTTKKTVDYNKTNIIVSNSFFFKNNVSQLKYKGKFLFDDIVEKAVKLNINEVANLKYGKLYALKLDSIEGVPNERLSLGYFYVQKDKIYKIESTEENLSKRIMNSDLSIGSVIVCQNKEIKDALGKDEPGFHYYLEVNGDKREYHSYNNKVSTGYYESFTWEKDKGLINYRSGYGAERDSIELQLINN